MARQSGLGKGLGALIPPEVAGKTKGDGPVLRDIPVGDIVPNPNQPRAHFDEESLADLAASIAEVGVLQPVLVRQTGASSYELVAGERRWRAARRAGLSVIPAVVRATSDMASVEQALIENLHRADLTPLEEASAYQQLLDDFSLTHEQVAKRVGKSRTTVTNTLRLLTLPPSIQAYLADGRLSGGHAKALLGTPDRALQEQLAKSAVEEGWTVRMIEAAVRGEAVGAAAPDAPAVEVDDRPVTPDKGSTPTPRPLPPPGLLELEALLSDHLSTRVSVTMGASRGRVVIDFADLEDLERIYHQMTTGGD